MKQNKKTNIQRVAKDKKPISISKISKKVTKLFQPFLPCVTTG